MRSFPWDSIVEAMGDDGLPIYDRAYTAEDFRNVMQVFFSNGVFINSNDALQVTAGTGMTVTVAPGKGLINGTTAWEKDARTLEVTEAGTVPRIDTVVLRWDSNLDERKIDLYVIKGTAGNNPVRPNLTRTESVFELGLADIFIPANSTSISGDRITDTRLESARCGVAAPFMKIDTTTFYSQLEAALEKQTAELQKQTDRAVELAQNALDETTAGNLQSQIDAIIDPLIRENGMINASSLTVEQCVEMGTCYRLATLQLGELYKDGLLICYVTPDNSGLTNATHYVRLEFYSIQDSGNYAFVKRGARYNNNGTIQETWFGGWEMIPPSPGSITEDMLSSSVSLDISNSIKTPRTFNLDNNRIVKNMWIGGDIPGNAQLAILCADGTEWRISGLVKKQ